MRFQPRHGRLLAAAADSVVSIFDVDTQACRLKLQVGCHPYVETFLFTWLCRVQSPKTSFLSDGSLVSMLDINLCTEVQLMNFLATGLIDVI